LLSSVGRALGLE